MDYQRNIVTPCITAATMYLDINKARPDQIVTLGGLWWSIMPRIALGDYSWGLIGKTILKCSQSLFSAKVVFSHRLPGSISAATAVTSVLILGNKVVLTGWKMTELLIFYTQYNLSDSEDSVPGVAGPCPGLAPLRKITLDCETGPCFLRVCPTLSRLREAEKCQISYHTTLPESRGLSQTLDVWLVTGQFQAEEWDRNGF